MIIVITDWFDKYDRYGRFTGEKEFVVSHGIDVETGRHVILPCEPPQDIGAVFDQTIMRWVLSDPM